MKFTVLVFALLPHFWASKGQAVDENGVSLAEKLEAMERLLIPGVNSPGGKFEEGIESSVKTCGFFQTGDPLRGQQTSAEWVRIAFHDAITANIAAGTGGLDASIGFESDREENKGVAFIADTMNIFKQFSSVFISLADVIALGFTVSMISCDPSNRVLKLRVGRKDATVAGPFGVPEPTTDITTTLAQFAQANFTQSEAIALVACGHSLGAVNNADFPDVVPLSMVTPTNKDGNDSFDTSKDRFDNTVVLEYLSGTGKKGGPLVVGTNTSTNSDLRLYKSDNDVTIKTLTNGQKYQDTCFKLFEKMLDTVPGNVQLSAPLVPRAWSLHESHLDLFSNGVVSFSGRIQAVRKTGTPPTTAGFFYSTQGGGNTGSPTIVPQETIPMSNSPFTVRGFGLVSRYSFQSNITTPTTLGFNIGTFTDVKFTTPINLNVFPIPSQTYFRFGSSPTGGSQFWIRAAVVKDTPSNVLVKATLYYKVNLGPFNTQILKTTIQLQQPQPAKVVGNYKIFQGLVNTAESTLNFASHVEVFLSSGSKSKKTDGGLFKSCTLTAITDC